MPKVCIAIITYKRPKGLEKLLDALKSQQTEGLDIKIFVVDNDCTGENSKVIGSMSHSYPYQLKLVEESQRGIVSARNRAVDEFLKSDAEVLVFIDDDEWPVSNDWLMRLVDTQKEESCDIVYSDVYIVPESKKVRWVQDAFRIKKEKKEVAETTKFYTNNLLISRNVLEEISPAFDERFALTGSSDLHFAVKCTKSGFIAVHTPFAPVQEIFPDSRATLKWFFLRGYRSGEGATRANIYEGEFPVIHLKCIGMGGARFIYALWQFIKAGILLNKGILANAIFRLGASLGTFGGFLNLKYHEYKVTHGA
jgi:succinoglycan biosynthesis protein ExoM